MAGRKSKYKTHVEPFFGKIGVMLDGGASEEQVAGALGISYATFNNYKVKYPELDALCKKPRVKVVQDARSSLVRRANGFTYEEKEQYISQELDPITKQPIGNPVMRTKIVTKYAVPDTNAIYGVLNLYDNDYVKDRKHYDLKQQELELRKMRADMDDW